MTQSQAPWLCLNKSHQQAWGLFLVNFAKQGFHSMHGGVMRRVSVSTTQIGRTE